MVARTHSGFTIIEVMLFLAVGGLLTAGIMVGTGVAINTQRYKDAVATLQSDIQQQYEDVVAVKNDEATSAVAACAGQRGQTNCVLMGKLMTVAQDGKTVQYWVYGREPAGSAPSTDEITLINQYQPTAITGTAHSSGTEWGSTTKIKTSGLAADAGMSLLVLRSPQSGIAYTFLKSGVAVNNAAIPVSGSTWLKNTQGVICVNADGWAPGDPLAVVIGAGASSASAVEVRSNAMLGSANQC